MAGNRAFSNLPEKSEFRSWEGPFKFLPGTEIRFSFFFLQIAG